MGSRKNSCISKRGNVLYSKTRILDNRHCIILPSYVPGLSQTSAVMRLQSSRRSATLRNSDLLFAPLLTQVFKLSKYVSLWRPRSLFPSILPVRTALSKSSFLYTCPRKDSCLFLIVWTSFFVTPARRRTSSFLTFSVQEIRKILRRNNHLGSFNSSFDVLT